MIVLRQTRGKIRTVRLEGVCAAAAELRCARQTIWDVVNGHRRSRRIERWLARNLKKEPQL